MPAQTERIDPLRRGLRVVLGVGAALISLLFAALACGLIAAGILGPDLAEEPATAGDVWLVGAGLGCLLWAVGLFLSSVSLAEGRRNARRLALAMTPAVLVGGVVATNGSPSVGSLAGSMTTLTLSAGAATVLCGLGFLAFTDPETWTTAGPAKSRLLNPVIPAPSPSR